MRNFLTAACGLVVCCVSAFAQGEKPQGNHNHRAPSGTNYFNVTVPAHDLDIILARPEDRSIAVSVQAHRVMTGNIVYGTSRNALTNQTTRIDLPSGEPALFTLNKLLPDTQYYAEFRGQSSSAPNPIVAAFQFHTARAAGSSFTFTMTADVHLDEHTSAEVYQQTLANIRADAPDFHIDLGNLFMTDKHATRDEAWRQYLAQRYYLNQLGSPLFLALGVHDGEASRYDDGSPNSLASSPMPSAKNIFRIPSRIRFFTATRRAMRSPACWKIIMHGRGVMRCSWCSIRIATRCVPADATAMAGVGRSVAGNTTGSRTRWQRARQNTNSSSFTICSRAIKPRAAAWKSRGSTNGAAKIWTARKASRSIVPVGRCRCINSF